MTRWATRRAGFLKKNVCRAPRYRRPLVIFATRVFAEMAPHRGQSSGTKSRLAVGRAKYTRWNAPRYENARDALWIRAAFECMRFEHREHVPRHSMRRLTCDASDDYIMAIFHKINSAEGESTFARKKRRRKARFIIARVILIVKSAIIISRKFFYNIIFAAILCRVIDFCHILFTTISRDIFISKYILAMCTSLTLRLFASIFFLL